MADLITNAMQSAVEEGVFPGAVLSVRFQGRPAYERAFGLAAFMPDREPATVETLYDLASLTKPLATATAVLCLIQDGVLSLDETVGASLPELNKREVAAATVAHLLRHSAGLPDWRPLYQEIAAEDARHPGFLGSAAARAFAVDYIGRQPPEYRIGTRSLYSDLGFMLLGLLIERKAGMPLDRYCRERIHRPLGIGDLLFRPHSDEERAASPTRERRIASTEDDLWRGRVLRGEVHDENAYALGGVAGHAGLFGTVAGVMAMADVWLNGYLGRNDFLPRELVQCFTRRDTEVSGSSRGLGWDTPSKPSSSGRHFSPRSFGHLGFTGTSLWIDPTVELEVVLLSNRVHPSRRDTRIHQFRPAIHDAIYETIVGTVPTGCDVT